MITIYGLIGAGGYGREVMPLVYSRLKNELASGNAKLYFVAEDIEKNSNVNGYPIISLKDFLTLPGLKKFNIAIGDSKVRERIANICAKSGLNPFNIESDNAFMMQNNNIADGVIISPFVTITSNVRIGAFFHANIYSYIAHDCVIGDFVTFAPAVKCNGNVLIEDHAYIGTGAIIKQGKSGSPLIIGRGAIVGMGAVVTKNVAPFTTVVGNPARPIQK